MRVNVRSELITASSHPFSGRGPRLTHHRRRRPPNIILRNGRRLAPRGRVPTLLRLFENKTEQNAVSLSYRGGSHRPTAPIDSFLVMISALTRDFRLPTYRGAAVFLLLLLLLPPHRGGVVASEGVVPSGSRRVVLSVKRRRGRRRGRKRRGGVGVGVTGSELNGDRWMHYGGPPLCLCQASRRETQTTNMHRWESRFSGAGRIYFVLVILSLSLYLSFVYFLLCSQF